MQNLYGVLLPPPGQSHGHPVQQPGDVNVVGSAAMAPPPDAEYSTREELLNFLKSWAASQGYAVVIGRSRTNRLWIRCDRGGEYRDKHAEDPSARKRKRKESRLTGCEFSIKASMRKDGIWRSRCECGEHNHGPSEDLREHPSLRRMTDEQMAKVHDLTGEGKTPAEIMEELNRLWPDIKVIRRDIYNARKNFKSHRDLTSDSSPNQSFDSNRISTAATSDSGRWSWGEEASAGPAKKRKLNSSAAAAAAAAAKMDAVSALNRVSNDGPSAQLAMEGLSGLPTMAPLPDQSSSHSGSWARASLSGSGQRPGMISPSNTVPFSPQSTDPRSSAATPLHTPSNEFGGTTANHLTANAGNLSHNPAFYPALMNNAASAGYSVPNNHHSAQNMQDRRPNTQPHVRSNLRNPTTNGSPVSPGASRRQSQAANAVQAPQSASNLQPPAALNNMNMAAVAASSGGSRPATASMPSSAGDGNVSATVTAAPSVPPSAPAQAPQAPQSQQQKAQSGAVIMQRMQRMEDELREQRSELREQRSMLNQILAAVQGLGAAGNSNLGGAGR